VAVDLGLIAARLPEILVVARRVGQLPRSSPGSSGNAVQRISSSFSGVPVGQFCASSHSTPNLPDPTCRQRRSHRRVLMHPVPVSIHSVGRRPRGDDREGGDIAEIVGESLMPN
jgi:hypothetical protein